MIVNSFSTLILFVLAFYGIVAIVQEFLAIFFEGVALIRERSRLFDRFDLSDRVRFVSDVADESSLKGGD